MNIKNIIANIIGLNTYTRIGQDTIKIEGVTYRRMLDKATPDFKTRAFLQSLNDNGFGFRGHFRLRSSWIYAYNSDKKTVWIQVHPQGDIAKVFIGIEDNTPADILNKIMYPDKEKESARLSLEGICEQMLKDIQDAEDNIDHLNIGQEIKLEFGKKLHESLRKIAAILR